MLRHFQQALTLLTAAERRRVYVVLGLSSLAAVVQALAILSIMPFILLLSNPSILETSELMMRARSFLGAGSYNDFLLRFGVIGIAVLTLGNLFLATEHWLSTRFLCLLGHRVEKVVLRKMLQQPYEYIIANNSAYLGDVVLNQVERVVDGIIGRFLVVFSNTALAVFVVAMLLIVSFQTTLVTLAALLTLYLAVFLLLRNRIARHGQELTRLSGRVMAVVRETLDGLAEIKTRSVEEYFARRFDRPSRHLSMLAIRYGILSFLPHFILETLVFTGLVAVALYFIVATDSPGLTLSLIALYGLAAYRLVPSLKAIFEGLSDMQHNADALRVVKAHCDLERRPVEPESMAATAREIRVEHVTFRYGDSPTPLLNDVNFSIAVGSSVCLFGASGSGKSTLLNVLAGVIRPRQGALLSDDTAIDEQTLGSWRRRVGYCPQNIFLFDDTVVANIAFGLPPGEIDESRIDAVAKLARLSHLPTGNSEIDLHAIIGEQGKTLSGGQRQRIGVARALYHDPEILIFDESFTGLDAANRDSIIDSLFALPAKTLIFASHEPEIADRCETVVMLEQGRVVSMERRPPREG